MQKHLVEIKARSRDHVRQRGILLSAKADFRGEDHQIDYYFNVPTGRLKLRSGRIEQSLIFYQRPDRTGPKASAVSLTRLSSQREANELATTLDRALGTWVAVDKHREIYFIENVKFHLDRVKGLGTFIEIEAIGSRPEEAIALREQCIHYQRLLGIDEEDLIKHSYSDLLANT